MADYPDSCLRGIRKSSWLIPGTDIILGAAFEPNLNPRAGEARIDGYYDASIDWEDTIDTIKTTSTNGNAQFGVIRLFRVHIDDLISENAELPHRVDCLAYERQALPDNPSHGNLLFLRSAPKPLINMLIGDLALKARVVA